MESYARIFFSIIVFIILVAAIVLLILTTRPGGFFLRQVSSGKYLYINGSNVGVTADTTKPDLRWHFTPTGATGEYLVYNLNKRAFLSYPSSPQSGDKVGIVTDANSSTTGENWIVDGTANFIFKPKADVTLSMVSDETESTLKTTTTVQDDSNLYHIF